MASFDQVARSFWDPGSTADLAPLTSELAEDAQRQLGVALPAALLTLLEIRNGGIVSDAWDACPAEPNFSAEDHVPFDQLFGIGPPYDRGGPLTILDTAYLVQEWDLPANVVLLSGDGHTWAALDYRHGGEPSVVWLDAEMGQQLTLAPTFVDFVELLGP